MAFLLTLPFVAFIFVKVLPHAIATGAAGLPAAAGRLLADPGSVHPFLVVGLALIIAGAAASPALSAHRAKQIAVFVIPMLVFALFTSI